MQRKEEYFGGNAHRLEDRNVVSGVTPDAMKSVIGPDDLSAGEYSVVANVSLELDDTLLKSERFISKFKLMCQVKGRRCCLK